MSGVGTAVKVVVLTESASDLCRKDSALELDVFMYEQDTSSILHYT
jgi:hypothetical protein